jgi:hypothetical protein
MEGGSLLGPRFHAATRWDASLSSKPGASCPRAAPRNRWQPACGVCGQYSQLSSLSPAKASPMAGRRHQKAAPGERPAPPACRWGCATPLAGLESKGPSASLHPTLSPPTRGGSGGVEDPSSSSGHASASFQSCAGTLSALMARATGSQCADAGSLPDHHQGVRRPASLRGVSQRDWRVARRLTAPAEGWWERSKEA